eukprot:13712287-Heterocapsa_arctica.AAC.1
MSSPPLPLQASPSGSMPSTCLATSAASGGGGDHRRPPLAPRRSSRWPGARTRCTHHGGPAPASPLLPFPFVQFQGEVRLFAPEACS